MIILISVTLCNYLGEWSIWEHFPGEVGPLNLCSHSNGVGMHCATLTSVAFCNLVTSFKLIPFTR